MIRLVLILVVLTCIATAFKCSSAEVKKIKNETGTTYNEYFPISDGNYWTYINEAPREETILFNVKAKDTKKVESGIQLKMSSFPYITKDEKEQSVTVTSDGEIKLNDYFGATGIFIPKAADFVKGYEWQFGVFKGYITRTGEKVETEAGTFDDCIYVMMTDGFTFSFEMWFKKDIGIVKWGSNRTNPPSQFIYYVLKEYKLN